MNKDQAIISSKKLLLESTSLSPSSLITLFEMDISDLAFDKGIIGEITEFNEEDRIFRFHNNIPLISNQIVWKGKTFYGLPVKAEGFEINGRGTLPTPKLSISTNEEGVPFLSKLKVQINRLGDLTGIKVTRIRTFYKYLDAINFENSENPNADPYVEFPRDVFYVDRKTIENKNTIEFELASILDVEGIKLPARIVVSNRCTWQYRGQGCLYESEANRNVEVHGPENKSRLPSSAPPVATEKGDLISELLPDGTSLNYRGKHDKNLTYNIGDYVYIEKNGIKYYFVAHTLVPENTFPPNGKYWIQDGCSKLVNNGCKYRWGVIGGTAAPGRANGNPHNGCLPFGGFSAVSKVR